MRTFWNPWHGCTKYSKGCENCYVYYLDGKRGLDASNVYKTKTRYDIPLQKDRYGNYKIKSGENISLCMTSDFFLPEADDWRPDVWDMIRKRPDVAFTIISKRITMAKDRFPADWGDGWDNVMLVATIECNDYVDERMKALLSLPAKHKAVLVAPIIGAVDLRQYLTEEICYVGVAGENYEGCRPCKEEWILDLRKQCIDANVTFNFSETGTCFIKDGRIYWNSNRLEQSKEAFYSGLSFEGRPYEFKLYLPDDTKVHMPQGDERVFRDDICAECGRRLVCSGCGGCKHCEKEKFIHN